MKVTLRAPEATASIKLVLDKAERRRSIEDELPGLLDVPQALAEKLGIERAIVAIDEFQYLALAKQAAPQIFHVTRSKWQFHRNITYVISGSLVGMINELLNSRNEQFYQFFYLMKLSPFTKETLLPKEGIRGQ